jgi:16S rRNA (adenine1518-N6/adenine1519-N6)-dimethyltransferase
MNKSELLEILAKMDMKPGKHFGQNFMIDNNLLDFISRESRVEENDLVIEVGPGCGALTRNILNKKASLIAIEIDKRICEYLTNNILDKNFTLIQGDACRIDLMDLLANSAKNKCEIRNWKCIANLPYSISSPFIAKIIETSCPPSEMLFLLQKETALRFAANVKTKNYGSLSVRVQTVFNVKVIRTIPPNVFYPAPEVDSALVRFTRKESFPSPEKVEELSITVKAAFSQRRKKMIKALSAVYGKDKTLNIFKELGIDTNARAEELSPDEFLILNNALND